MDSYKKYLPVAPFIVLVFVVLWFWGGRSKGDMRSQASPSPASSATMVGLTMGELKIEDQVVGTGGEAVAGKKVIADYSGTLTKGVKFDSSYDRGAPFSFNLGAGEVIKGWDQGVLGMKIGGKRKLTIPPELGYGAGGAGNVIPPNATLVFEIELLKVE